MKSLLLFLMTVVVVFSLLPSCLPLAAGAAAGYIAHDHGYRVRNPLTKSGD